MALKWPVKFLAEVPVNGLDGCILIERIASQLTTCGMSSNRASVHRKRKRATEGVRFTDSTLFFPSERYVVVQEIVLIDPDLAIGQP